MIRALATLHLLNASEGICIFGSVAVVGCLRQPMLFPVLYLFLVAFGSERRQSFVSKAKNLCIELSSMLHIHNCLAIW